MSMYRSILGAGLCLAALGLDAAQAQQFRWNLASSYPQSQAIFGPNALQFVQDVQINSGGKLTLRWHEPGALVPALQTLDAVQAGSVETSYTSLGFFLNKSLAFALFSAIPAGPAHDEYLAWFEHGGGNEEMDRMCAKFGVWCVVMQMNAPEASGWFRKEIRTFEDLKGLKMRFFGLGARVMDKLGVSTQLLAPGDIYPALERGVIDATEYASPAVDISAGFHKIAKYYYFPGWHQPSNLGQLIVTRAKYESLPDDVKRGIKSAALAGVAISIASSEAAQIPAVREFEKQGVQFRRWPDEFLKTFNDKWNEVAAELTRENEDFGRVWASLGKFRADYKLWREMQKPGPN
jgi:TRAP-type mannitol/chloroaromatic compound transport system substrate-binding protein